MKNVIEIDFTKEIIAAKEGKTLNKPSALAFAEENKEEQEGNCDCDDNCDNNCDCNNDCGCEKSST